MNPYDGVYDGMYDDRDADKGYEGRTTAMKGHS